MQNEAQFRDRSKSIFGIMHTQGWKEYLAWIGERKAELMDKMIKVPSNIELENMSMTDNHITVVVFNKDVVQSEYRFLCDLEKKIEAWKIEAMRPDSEV